MSEPFYFNGIDATTGEYLLQPLQPEQLSQVIAGEEIDPAFLSELKFKHELCTTGNYGVIEGVDPKNLGESGWGVIFPAKTDPAILDALRPLLDWRKEQAGDNYHEYTGVDGYRPEESKNDWLARHGMGPGPADPKQVPYYLLLVGDPQVIPYRFQTQLDVQYAVGRISFETLEEYANYAQSVVQAEKTHLQLPRKLSLFGVSNPGDQATRLSTDEMIVPLSDWLKENQDLPGWEYQTVLRNEARKARLGDLLGGKDTPAMLFTASHGMGFRNGHPQQLDQQGSLLCQDWPGTDEWKKTNPGKPIPEDFYFGAQDLPSDANLHGLISFFFACYGGGTPLEDEFTSLALHSRTPIAPKPFLARLPQKMLSLPKGGALAVIGHVDRAWGYSFSWPRAGRQLAVFESTFQRLMEGHPIGSALEFFNARYAELSSDLSVKLEDMKFGAQVDPFDLSGVWTANNDARNYAVLGDPAVRLMVPDAGSQATVERESITWSSPAPKAPVVVAETTVETSTELAPVTVVLNDGAAGKSSPVVGQITVLPGSQTGAETDFGVKEWLAPTAESVGNTVNQFVQKLGDFLGTMIENAASLQVSTYTSEDMASITPQGGKITGTNLNLRACTVIHIDGDIEQVLPKTDHGIDMEVWNLHMAMVREAQANRTELIRAAVAAAVSLTGLGGSKQGKG